MATTTTPDATPPDGCITAEELADKLRIGYRWVTNGARYKKLPHLRIGHKIMFTPEQVDEIVAKLTVAVKESSSEKRRREGR
ncbi:hypothetical protein ACFXJ8_26340 [Nonomuraea sp. NPDC059194]|uniref:hypothetical protein n=1 Tax=Nonomuraea sp. NPDC059194 TaxID=3346764 RepID=UPI0036765216